MRIPQHCRPVKKHVKTKSLGSVPPVGRIELACATCSGASIQPWNHIPLHSTSLTCQRKRRENESFMDWFTYRMNFESLGYTSLRQVDILRAFSKKRAADVGLEKQQANQ